MGYHDDCERGRQRIATQLHETIPYGAEIREASCQSRRKGLPCCASCYSGPQGGNCVEVAQLPDGRVAVRNSRHPAGPNLVFTAAEWDAFVGGARDGDFD